MIYNKDSFDALPTLPTDSVDLILTDPPYDFDEEQKLFLHSHFLRISRKGVIVFSPPERPLLDSVLDSMLFFDEEELLEETETSDEENKNNEKEEE